MLKEFFEEFWKAARQAPRMYFAPLIGAVTAIRQVLDESLDD